MSSCFFIFFQYKLSLNFVYSGHESFNFVFIRVLKLLWSNVSARPTVRVIAKVGDPGWKGSIGNGLAALIFSVILVSYLFY